MSASNLAQAVRQEAGWRALVAWARRCARNVKFGEQAKAARDLGWVRSYVWGPVSFGTIKEHIEQKKYSASPLQEPLARGGHANQDQAKPSPVRQHIMDFICALCAQAHTGGPPTHDALGEQIAALDDERRLALLREFVEALHKLMVAGKA